MADNYRTIQAKLQTLTPFKGNSMSGDWDGDTFVVYSYRTIIATNTPGAQVWATPQRYSVTTSKHQGYVRRAWGI